MLDQNTQKNEMEIAMIIASLPEERWVMKTARWNPELSMVYQTYRAVGRPNKRWEDEINDFLRPERTKEEASNVERNNDDWIRTAKDQEMLEEHGKQVRNRGTNTSRHRTPAQKQSGKMPDIFQTQ